MDGKRWTELMQNEGLSLTSAERAEGWHFCPEWDGLLIGPDDPEWSCCLCNEDGLNGDSK